MMQARILTPDVRVSGQLTVGDVRRAAAESVIRIINNRPDGEEPGQTVSADLQAAAQAVGIAYIHAPAVGMPGPDTVAIVGQALAQGGSTWMFCKSGMRSTAAWAMAMSQSGAMDAEAIRKIAADAGYDLSRLPL